MIRWHAREARRRTGFTERWVPFFVLALMAGKRASEGQASLRAGDEGAGCASWQYAVRMATSNDILGDVGEGAVAQLAKKAGFTVNESHKDRRGWDALLEIDAPTDPKVPLDRRVRGIKAFVQVKATRDAHSVEIKLSNMELACKDPSPWFFAFVVMDESNDERDLFLVHLDEELIARVLKRLREATVRGTDGDKLHQEELTIRWEDRHRLPVRDNAAFKERVLAEVGDVASYAKRKEEIRERVGYERGKLHAFAEFADGIDLVDAMIGLRPSVKARRILVSDQRFEIPIEVQRVGPTDLIFKPLNQGPSKVSIETRTGTKTAVVLDTFAPYGRVSVEAFKVRLKNELVSMTIQERSNAFRCQLAFDWPSGPILLSQLRDTARWLLAYSTQPSEGESFVVELPDGELFRVARVAWELGDDNRVLLQAAVQFWEVLEAVGQRSDADMVFAHELAELPATLSTYQRSVGPAAAPALVSVATLSSASARVLHAFQFPLVERVVVAVASLRGPATIGADGGTVTGRFELLRVDSFRRALGEPTGSKIAAWSERVIADAERTKRPDETVIAIWKQK